MIIQDPPYKAEHSSSHKTLQQIVPNNQKTQKAKTKAES